LIRVVAIDARAAAEVPAGRGRYVRELLKALAALPGASGVRFELWARARWDEPSLDPERFRWRLVSLPDPAWHVAVALRAGGDAFLSTNSYLTAWGTRIPTAVVVYDLVAFVPGAADAAQQRAARIERATIRPALRRAAALACISDATRLDLEARFPAAKGKTTTIPLAAGREFGADPLPLDPALGGLNGRPYVLAVGTLEPRKNLERLIAAWTALPEKIRGGHALALVGPRGWDEAEILVAARASGAVLVGHVPEDQLVALYAGATSFAYPSRYEGFGLPVLEAMAAGTPVVTSTASSLPEVAGDAALLVDPDDTAALTTALARLLTDAELRDDLRAKGTARAATFSWERTARETLALLDAIGS
jgi:glycosyltransferase involved in cell wall biosynthesis